VAIHFPGSDVGAEHQLKRWVSKKVLVSKGGRPMDTRAIVATLLALAAFAARKNPQREKAK
jgi:hypothetical protein